MALKFSEIDVNELTLGTLDLQHKTNIYESTAPKNFLCTGHLRTDNIPVVVQFEALLTANTILVSEFDNREAYSMPVELVNGDELEVVSRITEPLVNALKTQLENADEWVIKELLRDDKIYLKIKFAKNQKSPLCKTNVAMNAKKIHDAKIYQGQKVTVTAALNYYFNFVDNSGGVTLSVISLDFEIDEASEEHHTETPKRKSSEKVPDAPKKPKLKVPKVVHAQELKDVDSQ